MTIPKLFRGVPAALLVATQLCFGQGCGDAHDTAPVSAQAEYDGRTAFRAVFFNDGPASDRVRAIWTTNRPALTNGETAADVAATLENAASAMSAENCPAAAIERVRSLVAQLRAGRITVDELAQSPDQRRAAIDGIVAAIDRSNPGFFDVFARDVQSGDPTRVDTALTNGAIALKTASASAVAPGSTIAPHPGPIPTPITGPVAPHPGPIGGAEYTIIDAASIVYTSVMDDKAVVAFAGGFGPGSESMALQRDQLASMIARAFAQ